MTKAVHISQQPDSASQKYGRIVCQCASRQTVGMISHTAAMPRLQQNSETMTACQNAYSDRQRSAAQISDNIAIIIIADHNAGQIRTSRITEIESTPRGGNQSSITGTAATMPKPMVIRNHRPTAGTKWKAHSPTIASRSTISAGSVLAYSDLHHGATGLNVAVTKNATAA